MSLSVRGSVHHTMLKLACKIPLVSTLSAVSVHCVFLPHPYTLLFLSFDTFPFQDLHFVLPSFDFSLKNEILFFKTISLLSGYGIPTTTTQRQ